MVTMPVKDPQLTIFQWSMIICTLLLVLLRLYHRYCGGRLALWEDGFVVLAWCCFVNQVSLDTVLFSTGFFSDELDTLAPDINKEIGSETELKIFYAENATYYFCMYAVKAAMLCFYTKLFPLSMTKTRVCLWITVLTTIIGFVVSTMLNLLLCFPISRNWDPLGNCSAGWTHTAGTIVPYVFHLLTDVMIYILPFSIVRILPLPNSQKIGVGITFALGFLCIVFAVAVIIVGYVSSSATTNWVIATLEQTWAISVACAPALKGLTKAFDFKEFKARLTRKASFNHREKPREVDDYEAEAGTITSAHRPDSDATTVTIAPHRLSFKGGLEEGMGSHGAVDMMAPAPSRASSLQKQKYRHKAESILTQEDKRSRSSSPFQSPVGSPSPKYSQFPDHMHKSPVSQLIEQSQMVTSSGASQRQSYDTEVSSPRATISIASIIDFHDLERQLQMDDERRFVKNCSPVLERRSSEQQFNLTLSKLEEGSRTTSNESRHTGHITDPEYGRRSNEEGAGGYR